MTRFLQGTAEEAHLDVFELDVKGTALGETRRVKTPWAELQKHGSFPAAQTTIASESRTVPAGTFECWRYEVRSESSGRPSVQRFWFAKETAGPPIHMEVEADGRLQSTMT